MTDREDVDRYFGLAAVDGTPEGTPRDDAACQRCGHPEYLHTRGSCYALVKAPGFAVTRYCPCEGWLEAVEDDLSASPRPATRRPGPDLAGPEKAPEGLPGP